MAAAAAPSNGGGRALSCYHFPKKKHHRVCCSLPFNGCGSGAGGGPDKAVGICQTRTLPAVSAPELAVPELKLAVAALNEDPPHYESGIIRLEVPIRQRADAIDWLHAQHNLPRCYFSSRGQGTGLNAFAGNGSFSYSTPGQDFVSVAGVGSAVIFQRFDPFALQDWRCIKRFLSKDSPLIRAYGGIRFDAKTDVSLDWKDFGSFYFLIPQVEFDELEEGSMIATTIAWDNTLLWTWEKAMDGLQDTMHQISPYFNKLWKSVPRTAIISCSHVPTKISWDVSVKKALEMINRRNSDLVKVVLARCSNVVTDTDIDPLTMLACLQIEAQNAYQFYIQPPDAPAFIGNTPEQLFHRKFLNISSEALAGTRARGLTKVEDLQIGQNLLFSPKDDAEFTIVRESIRRKMKTICSNVLVEPSKALRKLPRVQHLSAQLSGRLKSEDDEFDILASLHPSPAVCGLPTEEARQFIQEYEMFDRGMYAGPIGWFGGSESEFAVGIRSALVGKTGRIISGRVRSDYREIPIFKPNPHSNEAVPLGNSSSLSETKQRLPDRVPYLKPSKDHQIEMNSLLYQFKGFSTLVYAGAGIVNGTNPSSEWEELDLKASQFMKLLEHQEVHTRCQGVKNLGTANQRS